MKQKKNKGTKYLLQDERSLGTMSYAVPQNTRKYGSAIPNSADRN